MNKIKKQALLENKFLMQFFILPFHFDSYTFIFATFLYWSQNYDVLIVMFILSGFDWIVLRTFNMETWY